jgi:hypothetical protein
MQEQGTIFNTILNSLSMNKTLKEIRSVRARTFPALVSCLGLILVYCDYIVNSFLHENVRSFERINTSLFEVLNKRKVFTDPTPSLNEKLQFLHQLAV